MKQSPFRDALLMLAPVVALGAFGWLFRARKTAVIKPPPTGSTVIKPVSSFRPFIRRVQVLPARPVDVFDGYDTRVVVELNARGPLPPWWTTGVKFPRSADGGQLSRVKADKVRPLPQTGYCAPPSIDPKSKQWVTTYNLRLRDIAPQDDQIRLGDMVQFADDYGQLLAQLPLDTPVRESGQATVLPHVSHANCVKIEKFSLDPTPPTLLHDGSERWRASWVLLENIPRADAEKNSSGAIPNIQLFNERKQQVGGIQGYSYGPQDISATTHTKNKDPRRHFISVDYNLNPKGGGPNVLDTHPREPLWIEGDIRSGDKWPVSIKIPLRDATGKILLTPRTASVPFHIVSATRVAPTPDETRIYGTDCVVSVTLKAWNPHADVSKWRWEADYSQHLRSANTGNIWDFPLKFGKRSIYPSYMRGQKTDGCELRYQIVLESVPATAGKLVFHADIAANRSRRVPVEVVVRP